MGRKDTRVQPGKLGHRIRLAAMLGIAIFATKAKAQAGEDGLPKLPTVIEPLRSGVTENQVLTELAAHNEHNRSTLHDYTALRTYQVIDLSGKVDAEEIGQMEFVAPDKKVFTVTSETGSGVVRHMALNALINSEIEAEAGKDGRDTSISAENYSLNLLGEQQVGSYRCFVFEAIPKRRDKYLFEGTVWVDVNDYSVVRIAGHPATKPSFWVQRADFVRQYQKIDGFWVPQKDQALVQVRFDGTKVLKIEHRDYVVNGAEQSGTRHGSVATLVTSARIGQVAPSSNASFAHISLRRAASPGTYKHE